MRWKIGVALRKRYAIDHRDGTKEVVPVLFGTSESLGKVRKK